MPSSRRKRTRRAATRSPARTARWDTRRPGYSPAGIVLVALGAAGLLFSAFSRASREPSPVSSPARAAPAATGPAQRPEGVSRATPSPAPQPAAPGEAPGEARVEMEEDVVLPRDGSADAAKAPVAPRGGVEATAAVEFSKNPAATHAVALTFDGCYDDGPVDRILEALRARGWQATFFVAGRFAERYPNSVRRIAEAGMEIGNHSWSHPDFTALSDGDVARELDRTSKLVEALTGRSPTLFRPPYGARNERTRRLVAGRGLTNVYWSLDSWDAVKKGVTAEEVRGRVLSRLKPGDVVLLHIGSRATADALPEILADLDRKGLRVVPVGELMGIRLGAGFMLGSHCRGVPDLL